MPAAVAVLRVHWSNQREAGEDGCEGRESHGCPDERGLAGMSIAGERSARAVRPERDGYGTESPFYRVVARAKLRRSNIAGPSFNGRTPDLGKASRYGGPPLLWLTEHENAACGIPRPSATAQFGHRYFRNPCREPVNPGDTRKKIHCPSAFRVRTLASANSGQLYNEWCKRKRNRRSAERAVQTG